MKGNRLQFRLNPGQLRFLRCTAPNVLLCGGFGSGKTLGLMAKLLQLKIANQDTPGLLISQNLAALTAVVLPALQKILPKSKRPGIKDRRQGGAYYLDFGDGVPVYLRSANRPASYDGLDVGWMVGDELRHWPSKEAYDVAIGRRRLACPFPQSAFTSTPAMGWMSDEYNSGKPDRPIIIAPTIENIRNLVPDFVDNLRSSYSPRMQQVVLEGQFRVLEGAVFEEFDASDTSLWLSDFDPGSAQGRKAIEKGKVILAVDPGYRRSAWLWIVQLPTEDEIPNWVVFDQRMPDNEPDNMSVHRVNERGWPVDEVWFDPAAGAKQSLDGRTVREALRRIKARQIGASPLRDVGKYRAVQFGVDKLRVLLGGYDDKPIKIKFARRLLEQERNKPRGIIKDLSCYRYPEAKDNMIISDLPFKDGLTDHSCDALRYFAVGMWRTIPVLKRLLDRMQE